MDDMNRMALWPNSEADYRAVKALAIRNGGEITNDEIFSIIVRGYWKLGLIKDRLYFEGVIRKEGEGEERTGEV